MSLVFMDGFDAKDFGTKWSFNQAGTTSSTTRFGSGSSLAFSGANGYMYRTFTAITNIYFGFAFMFTSAYVNDIVRLYGDSNATNHIRLTPISSGSNIGVYRGGTLLGSFSLNFNVWYYIEVNATINSSTGTIQVKVNGVSVFTYNGNTQNGGTNLSIDGFWLLQSGGCYFDDLYICNNSGTVNNTFLGDVRVQTLVPNAAGTSTQWAATGGANYANVADIPDNTATYNMSSTVGQRDTYAMADLASGTTNVLGVQENLHAWKGDAGIGNLKPAYLIGGTVYYDSVISPGTSSAWYGSLRETNPATSTTWTPGDVNGMEFGAEVA